LRWVKNVAPLACKTDKVDARVLAELCRRELVPALWIPSLEERALRERLKRRLHLVRLRTSAKNRIFGLLTQWGLRIPLARLRQADALELLESRGMPEVWRRSVAEALEVIELLDARIAPLDQELGPLARADRRVCLLSTIPGIGPVLGLTIATEIGEVARFPSPRKLIGHAGLAPRIKQSGRLARDEPLAPALRGREGPHRQGEPGQERRRPQDPDRLLARAQPPTALQAQPPAQRSCPGKLQLLSGRLTARTRIEKPGQLLSEMVRRTSAEREMSVPRSDDERS
jgi:hypothetical protein